MNLFERMDESREYKYRQWKSSVSAVRQARKDLGDLLSLNVPGYPAIYLSRTYVDLTFADNRATALLLEDKENEELREQVAAFNKLVSAVMNRAGVSQLEKTPSNGNLESIVHIDGPGTHYRFVFLWNGLCKTKKYRVTKVTEIEICGDLSEGDREQYDSVEEITD